MGEGDEQDGEREAASPSPELRPWSGATRAASLAAGAIQRQSQPQPAAAASEPAASTPQTAPADVQSPEPAAARPPLDLRRLGMILAALLALYLGSPLLPLLRGDVGFRIEVYLASVVFFGLVAWGILVAAPLRLAPRMRLVAAGGVFLVLLMLGNLADIPVITDLLKLAFATTAGFAILTLIERPWWLIPVCVFVPMSDAWSVYSSRGVTNKIIEKSQENSRWLDWPTVLTPTFGVPHDLSSRIGIVDIFFAAIFLGAAARWAIPAGRVAIAVALSFVLSTVLAVELSGVPALPLLCLAFLIVASRDLLRDLRAEFAADG